MGSITAKELRRRTGEFIRRLKAGEKFSLTHRGKVIATVTPAEDTPTIGGDPEAEDREWRTLLDALRESEPSFGDWEDATRWVRGRHGA